MVVSEDARVERPPYLQRLQHVLSEYLGSTTPMEQQLSMLQEAIAYACHLGELKVPLATAVIGSVQSALNEPGQPSGGLDPQVCRAAFGRPRVKPELEQLPIIPWTAQCRARRMLDCGDALLLGDDDMVGVALRCAGAPLPCVIDVDDELVQHFAALDIPALRHDLRDPLPAEMNRRFDVVETDPPWAAAGMSVFVRRAAEALRPGGILMLTTNRTFLESPRQLDELTEELGLGLQEIHTDFNRYPFPDELRADARLLLCRLDVPPDVVMALTAIPYLYADLHIYRK
ncbi:MAG: bis-aminopropyl spermidine synthase family protein [Candidatus Xenobia bacterium]